MEASDSQQRAGRGHTDMAVLELETDRLTAPLKREPSRSGEIYPHIYGKINTDAVVRWWPAYKRCATLQPVGDEL